MSLTHLDKTVLCLGEETQATEKSVSPVWLIGTAKRILDPELGSVVEMILNWGDSKNKIINFRFQSWRADKFKPSKRGK